MVMKIPKQLGFPVTHSLDFFTPVKSATSINAGQRVRYLGNVAGGPELGTLGVVQKIFARKAVVDMGKVGTWNVPYYFLAHVRAAA
ncbi:MAG: hypothetical protein BZY65_00535 [SAR202 cluster bacterium Ae2-Chloro-G2]|nr:MAG: hypothetical protein BZY65_00535 [SAR202 cluster bacterium Ae2-Chloro-G2]